MVKQIRNEEVVGKLIDQGDGYFHWLQGKTGLSGPLTSMLAETKFVSVDGLDDVLEEKAKEEMRRMYTEEIAEKEKLDDKETEDLNKSIRGNCCLFEVILCLAVSINEMFEDLSAYDGPAHFVKILMENAGFDRYDEEDWDMREEEVKAYWERCIRRILERTYSDIGGGGFFTLKSPTDNKMNEISLWQQMNDWVDQHTNEDGEWVD